MARQDQPVISLSSFFSDSPHPEEVDAKIQSLKLQVRQINDAIRRLEEYRNTRFLTVSRLPPEVLSTILESLAMGSTAARLKYPYRPYGDLLSATQVCRLWRQVALESPRIWSYIFPSESPRLIELFLERSKSAPLYLIRTPLSRKDAIMTGVPNYLHRLKEIDSSDRDHDWFKGIMFNQVPRLERLSLKNSRDGMFDATPNTFPMLQHLFLTHYFYTSSVASLSTLRSLSINCKNMLNTSRLPNAVDFLAILKSLPHLSILALTHALGPLEATTQILMLSVTLSNLTELSIEDHDIRNIGMMACITASRIKTVKLWHTGRAKAEISTPIVAAIYLKLPGLTSSYSELSLSTDYMHSLAYVQLWSDCTPEESTKLTPFFQLRASGSGDLGTEHSVLTLLPLKTHPSTLYFDSEVETLNDDSQPLRLQDILRQLSGVTEIRTSRLMDVTLVLCDSPVTRQPMLLPSLQKIVIDRPEDYIKYKRRLLSRLKKQLKARKALDAGIETWELDDADRGELSSADLNQFKGLVDVVKVKHRPRIRPGSTIMTRLSLRRRTLV